MRLLLQFLRRRSSFSRRILLLLSIGVSLAASETNESSTAVRKVLASQAWTLSHSYSTPEKFVKRGRVLLELVQPEDNQPAEPVWSAENSVEWSESDVQALLDNGWYHLQLQAKGNGKKAPSVRASIPACQLRRANFRDELALTLSAAGNEVNVLSLGHVVQISPLAPATCDQMPLLPPKTASAEGETDSKTVPFETTVSWELDTPGMTLHTVLPQYPPPPGLQYLRMSASGGGPATTSDQPPPGLGSGKATQPGEAPPPEPVDTSFLGFLKRYWYVFLPFLISNIFGGMGGGQEQQQQPPPQQQQGQGPPSGGGGGRVAAAPAPAASPSGTARQRRGKRA